jgi:hypothetical protein
MYDAGKIGIGIIIFLILITSPIWYNLAVGKGDYAPDPKIITDARMCVMPTDYMRSDHMDILNEWRHDVVRSNDREFYSSHTGRIYDKSLTNTCLDCHSNKSEFCDACHDYSAVGQPDCWQCHVVPEEGI